MIRIEFVIIFVLMIMNCAVNNKNLIDYPPKNTYKYSENILINYEILGEGAKTIIFLHGFGASLYSWNDIKFLFPATEYRLYLIDLKGFGYSSKPHDKKYTINEQSKIIAKFMESKALENVTLVGHSYGGGVALLTQLRFLDNPKIITKLILLDCAAYPDDIPSFIDVLRNPILNFISLNLISAHYRAEFTLKRIFYDLNKVTKEKILQYAKFFSINGAKYSFTQAAKQIIPEDYERILQSYSEIETNTLIIWGEKDTAIPFKYGKKLHETLPKSQLEIIKKCGHVPHEEMPLQTYKLMEAFLGGTK
ncbi:MAG: alpha/beta hydrolase [candidate division Zixibacteria bacterium]|nr:alpha/beta hydrolase [candidate division Zixibacteria bacterium]